MLENETLWELTERIHALLERKGIDHAIVGGLAVCLHGYRRNTVDLDLLIRPEDTAEVRSALEADVTFGPAHNNLGRVYYHQGQLYLDAWEFQYAIKLMPYQPEPKSNLGLVLEAANKLDEAIKNYDEAMNLEPENPQFLGNDARARARRWEHCCSAIGTRTNCTTPRMSDRASTIVRSNKPRPRSIH